MATTPRVLCAIGIALILTNPIKCFAQYPQVAAISASAGGPATIVIVPEKKADRERVTTSRVLIVQTLAPALLSGASEVKIDRVKGSNVVQRVEAFGLGNGPIVEFYGEYRVSRIATQRMSNGDDHLEVFVIKEGEKKEMQYNVRDPILQALLVAAFQAKGKPGVTSVLVDLQIDDKDIVTVTLGEKVEFKK